VVFSQAVVIRNSCAMNKLYCLIIFFFTCRICEGQNIFQITISAPDSNLYCIKSNILQSADSSFLILCNNGIFGVGPDTTKLCLLKINSAGNILWQKIISSDTSVFWGYIAGANNGFMIAVSSIGYYSALTLINFNSNGDTLWTKAYPHLRNAGYLKQMPNGDWIVIGDRVASPYGHYIMRTDSQGNSIDCNNYPAGATGLLSGCVTSDGGKLIFPSTPLLTKIDAAGNILWSMPEHYPFYTNDAVETQDSCYMVLTGSGQSIVCFKVNNSGDTLWTKGAGNAPFNLNPMAIISLPDGGFGVCGSINNPTQHVLLLRLDSLANVLWSKSYIVKVNSEEVGYQLFSTNDNGFIIEGISYDTIPQK
jgi:hypothetical protein